MEKCTKCNESSMKVNEGYRYHDIFECTACETWTFRRIENCCRNPFTVVTIHVTETGLRFLYRQCLTCGGCLNRSKPLNSKIFGEDIRGDFHTERYINWKEERKSEGNDLYSIQKEITFRTSKRYKYLTYLSSYEWKEKRKAVLDRDGNLCQTCKQNPAFEVHHLTYDNLYNEPLKDLVALCSDCHAKAHNKYQIG